MIVAARADGPFASIEELARRAALPAPALRKLADADALGSLGKQRREAGWDVRRTPTGELPLFAYAKAPELGTESDPALPAMPAAHEVVADYQTTRLSLKGHPVQFLRDRLRAEGVVSCAEVNAAREGRRLACAGVVLIRQRPGKGNAIFITIEDESGIVNALLWARDMERQRRAVMAARLMLIAGVVQRSSEGVVHLMAHNVIDRTAMLDLLGSDTALQPEPFRADEVRRMPGSRGHGHPRDVRILPKARDFH